MVQELKPDDKSSDALATGCLVAIIFIIAVGLAILFPLMWKLWTWAFN